MLLSPVDVFVPSQPLIDCEESFTLPHLAVDEFLECMPNLITVDQSCSDEPILDEDVARGSAKIAEVYQINDPVHKKCQDPLDIVIDSATDFIKAEVDQNITSNDIPEVPVILKQKIIEL
jgi:hypothetical protein